MTADKRCIDRRLTDQEIEQVLEVARDVLPREKEFIASAPRRFTTLGISLATVVAITTLIQTFYLSPIQKELEEVESRMSALDSAVRQHHEQSAIQYVLKRDYDRDMGRVLSELSELKGMLLNKR